MPPLRKLLERRAVFLFFISIECKGSQHGSIHIVGKDIPEDFLAGGDEGTGVRPPVGVEDSAVLLLYFSHTPPPAEEGEREGIGNLGETTYGDVEIVRDILTSHIRFDAVKGDIFIKRKQCKRCINEIKIVPSEAEDTIPDNLIGHPENSGNLPIPRTGIQAVIEVTQIYGDVCPVVY